MKHIGSSLIYPAKTAVYISQSEGRGLFIGGNKGGASTGALRASKSDGVLAAGDMLMILCCASVAER